MFRYFPKFVAPKNLATYFGGQKVSGSSFTKRSTEEENPFLKKYADKIASFQNTSPEEYESRIRNLKVKPKSALLSSEETTRNLESKNTIKPSKHHLQIKALESFMKLELLQDKSSEEIESIWKLYHKDKLGVYAVLPNETYERIFKKLEKYPTFLFPLPRSQGYEFIVSQLSGNSCYFTPLINFQAYKENAPVCFTLTYYSEFQESKDIILMRGEFDDNILKAHEAQCLTNQLQLYYGVDNPKRDRLLWNFTNNPESFKHMDLISELEFGIG